MTRLTLLIQRFPSFRCTSFPCYRPHYSRSHRFSLSFRQQFSLSHQISHIQSLKDFGPPQKGSSPPIKKHPGVVHCIRCQIWPEKDRDFFGHPKLQTIDSLSSDINAHQKHHHQNPLHQIYQNLSFLAQNLAEDWSGRAS